jgi:hypothetical protein
MHPRIFLFLILAALTPSLRADLAHPDGLTVSAKAGDKFISTDDFAFTQKDGYVHLLLNASPYPAMTAKNADLVLVVKGLIKVKGLVDFPGSKLFKVDVADISARDDYGLPNWEKVKLLQRLTVTVGKKGLSVQKVKAQN